MKRKFIVYPLIGLLVLLLGLAGLWYWIGLDGTSPLERWIGQQVLSITNSYLTPQASFDDLDYQAPYTVVLTNFRLTAQDPDLPGETLDVIRIRTLRMELAEIPEVGKPIRIKKLTMDHPAINAIAAESDGRFIGFHNLIKKTAQDEAEPAQPAQSATDATGNDATPSAGQDAPPPAETPLLSDVFQIVMLEIIEGRVVYDARRTKQPPLVLDHINSRMDLQKDAQGWYKLAVKASRAPLFRLAVSGRLDLDHLVLALESLEMDIELDANQYSTLPGSLQEFLAKHEVTGKAMFSASGRVPLGDAMASDLTATLSMEKMHFVAGKYKGEVTSLDAKLRMKDGVAALEHLDAETLKGKVHVDGEIVLADPFKSRVHVTAKDIRLEELFRAAHLDQSWKEYRGLVNTDVTLTGPMSKILTHAAGGGWLTLREGQLVQFRVLFDIGRALSKTIRESLSREKNTRRNVDAVDLKFQFSGNRVHFTELLAQTSQFAIKGHGDIWFNKRLVLLLNAGALERLQAEMHKETPKSGNEVFDVIGAVLKGVGRGAADILAGTASILSTVVVKGTIDEPKVRIEPFRKIRDALKAGFAAPGSGDDH